MDTEEDEDEECLTDLGEAGSEEESSVSKSNKMSLLRLGKHKSFSTGSILSSSPTRLVNDFDFFAGVCRFNGVSLTGSDFRFLEIGSCCTALLVESIEASFTFGLEIRTRQDLRVIKAVN